MLDFLGEMNEMVTYSDSETPGWESGSNEVLQADVPTGF